MIEVHPTIYRTLWGACAVFGALFALVPLTLLLEPVRANDRDTLIVMTASFVIGTFLLIYAIRRLARPLKAAPPPQ